MSEREFWWASCFGGDPQVVEAWRSGSSVSFLVTGNDEHLDEDEVRLIERIQPPSPRPADLAAVGSFHG
ncbi:hypothetical protein OKC48_07400 [Methylorubrum extorquens]|uniref:hypothetical protein n=1 Tax=Methylorubrum extorquens TaxID=408 RepID=UPI00223774F2|nr:hypothetical protein [Methylorubrum extorquens]UYW28331.1 hypothetical protein OKC48_07400 [Methylorubrum extorquens]